MPYDSCFAGNLTSTQSPRWPHEARPSMSVAGRPIDMLAKFTYLQMYNIKKICPRFRNEACVVILRRWARLEGPGGQPAGCVSIACTQIYASSFCSTSHTANLHTVYHMCRGLWNIRRSFDLGLFSCSFMTSHRVNRSLDPVYFGFIYLHRYIVQVGLCNMSL